MPISVEANCFPTAAPNSQAKCFIYIGYAQTHYAIIACS